MLQIKGHKLEVPVIQGGMGVGISLGGLAGAVAACGAMGVISSANTGYREADFALDPAGANLRALAAEVQKARSIAGGRGLVGVNVMVATRQYADAVRCAVAAGADAVICGAGLPTDLPELVADNPVLIAPVVSSAKAARTLCRLWDRRFARVPDFVVAEGPLAGGHLGFKPEELAGDAQPDLLAIIPQIRAELAPYEAKYGRRIPLFAAGGVFDGQDAAAAIHAGADGVQVATRFICTPECDAADGYKQAMLAAKADDVVIVKSPVGMPGRALKSPLMERVAAGRVAPRHCSGCIVTCKPAQTPYCITEALIAAARGDWENGLFFCGSNVGRINRMQTAAEIVADLTKFL